MSDLKIGDKVKSYDGEDCIIISIREDKLTFGGSNIWFKCKTSDGSIDDFLETEIMKLDR